MIYSTDKYDIKIGLSIAEAKMQLQNLENQLDYWTWERKILLENAEGVKATVYDKEKVNGGIKIDNNASVDKIIDTIDPIIKLLKLRIKNIIRYIEDELKMIGEYEPIEAKIIKLREEKRMKWDDISIAVNYSERHCRRIYDKYKSAKIQKK